MKRECNKKRKKQTETNQSQKQNKSVVSENKKVNRNRQQEGVVTRRQNNQQQTETEEQTVSTNGNMHKRTNMWNQTTVGKKKIIIGMTETNRKEEAVARQKIKRKWRQRNRGIKSKNRNIMRRTNFRNRITVASKESVNGWRESDEKTGSHGKKQTKQKQTNSTGKLFLSRALN